MVKPLGIFFEKWTRQGVVEPLGIFWMSGLDKVWSNHLVFVRLIRRVRSNHLLSALGCARVFLAMFVREIQGHVLLDE